MTYVHWIGFTLISFLFVTILFNNFQKRRKLREQQPILGNIDTLSYDDEATLGEKRVISKNKVTSIQHTTTPASEEFPEQETVKPTTQKRNRIFVINILAEPTRCFAGYELLQALLAAGLRFGNMNIFHRYKQLNNKNEILFSIASATEPGTFDLQQMGGFSCKGLSVFMQLTNTHEDTNNVKLMFTTAQQLAQDLGGSLYNRDRQPFTETDLYAYMPTQENIKIAS